MNPSVDFFHAVLWFLMLPAVVKIIVGSLTVLAIAVGLLFVLRKWGDFA